MTERPRPLPTSIPSAGEDYFSEGSDFSVGWIIVLLGLGFLVFAACIIHDMKEARRCLEPHTEIQYWQEGNGPIVPRSVTTCSRWAEGK